MVKLGRIVYVSGEKYAAERIAAGLNQQGLAEKLGVTPGYISKIERSEVKGLYLKHIVAMAEVVMKVPLAEAVRRLSPDVPDPFKTVVGEPPDESGSGDGAGKRRRRVRRAARPQPKPPGPTK
jgi:transcriptional regulator with XRE-family HTH domain